jgi:hypothetical protein
MNVHGALNHCVWRVGVHDIEDRGRIIRLEPISKDFPNFTRRIRPLFLSTRQQQGDINGSVKWDTTLAIGTVPVVALAATVISSSPAMARRAGESTSPEDHGLGQIDISAAAMGHVHSQI